MDYVLKTNELTKIYKNKKVVDNVDMNIKKGEIYGFLGPNGAGKSTILKMILNLVKPNNGKMMVFGKEVNGNNFETLKRIGSIIENPYFYNKLTGRENLELHCAYMGCHNKQRIDEVLSLVGLFDIEGKEVCNYSLGMKQRLAIARAILTKPEFLILDEPINGLDPEGIKEIRLLIKKLNEKYGTTILISSHILSEIELIADRIGIIKDGKLLKEVSMDKVHEYSSEYIELEVNNISKSGYLIEEKMGISNYKIISENKIRIYDINQSQKVISKILIQNGVELESIGKKKSTLEEYFLKLIQEDNYVAIN
ncbi:ABC transporter ATP-binding protein [Clostridium botulinum]|uniref:ABC transporter ATP-binding protein n=1 Tax=Clostridium botulinum TaxID=1491 RepID=UPI001A92229E|nr:ABC transporter ATP-binding protein [Clostridium botulinum]MBO0525336.1 ABC transporter ATP-binding protein [Clostridium botulinum]MBO0527451.1 ABC transporter ATP-binding protein [Clostridium botulinum]MBO0531648.1 ABC transporter ATP-binding protein [Clostridium botulinum]MBO0535462.1 ABC transporter ATP-binding protein [Clostridium botulinum]MBO0537949.1 ABC transporter ATP-binding protein [Clostridium botulinum]